MNFTDQLNVLQNMFLELERENAWLEQENKRQAEEITRLKSQPAPNPEADEFIRLMGPHMAPIEAKYDEPNSTLTESMRELVRAYRLAKS